jgi:AcrR family transcriptional regulator
VARITRLSRALVYVYFRDKEDLLFAIGERALRLLYDRFKAAIAGRARGMDQVEAIGRAYMGYAHEFPHYFDFSTRFQSHPMNADPSTKRRSVSTRQGSPVPSSKGLPRYCWRSGERP